MLPGRIANEAGGGTDHGAPATVPEMALPSTPSAHPTPGSRGPGPAREVDVLVACVDEDARRIVGTVLRHEGWRVLEIGDPARAVETALARRPLLVVTSYPAELGDGRTVTAALRADARTADLPILSVTGRALPDELARAEAAGVTSSLVMPVPPLHVVAEVRRLLGEAGTASRARRLVARERPDGGPGGGSADAPEGP